MRLAARLFNSLMKLASSASYKEHAYIIFLVCICICIYIYVYAYQCIYQYMSKCEDVWTYSIFLFIPTSISPASLGIRGSCCRFCCTVSEGTGTEIICFFVAAHLDFLIQKMYWKFKSWAIKLFSRSVRRCWSSIGGGVECCYVKLL